MTLNRLPDLGDTPLRLALPRMFDLIVAFWRRIS